MDKEVLSSPNLVQKNWRRGWWSEKEVQPSFEEAKKKRINNLRDQPLPGTSFATMSPLQWLQKKWEPQEEEEDCYQPDFPKPRCKEVNLQNINPFSNNEEQERRSIPLIFTMYYFAVIFIHFCKPACHIFLQKAFSEAI